VRGDVHHRDHKTIDLCGWHRAYMNRERLAPGAPQIAGFWGRGNHLRLQKTFALAFAGAGNGDIMGLNCREMQA
jgi:hypothetical protein